MYGATPPLTLRICWCADHLFCIQAKAVDSLKRLVKKPLKGWCLTLCWPPNQLAHLQDTACIFGAGELSHKQTNRETGGEHRVCAFFYFVQLFLRFELIITVSVQIFNNFYTFGMANLLFLSPTISDWSTVTNFNVLMTWNRSIKPFRLSDVCWDEAGADTKLGIALSMLLENSWH